jgi:hypothetical protein
MINKELNEMDVWKDKTCTLCGRKYPDTVLNVEGYIHSGIKLQCEDVEDCKKAQENLANESV